MSDVPSAVTDATASVLQAVTDKLGATKAKDLAPVIQQYGPAFAAMTSAEIWAWIDLAVQGDPYKAYSAIVSRLPSDDLVSQWASLNQQWKTQNEANVQSLAWQKDAVSAVLKALVSIAASLVVL